jgi:hypothetical protein
VEGCEGWTERRVFRWYGMLHSFLVFWSVIIPRYMLRI